MKLLLPLYLIDTQYIYFQSLQPCFQLADKTLGIPVGSFDKQGFLVFEVGIDGGLGDTRGIGDFLHADLVVGLGAENGAGGVDNQVFTNFPFLLLEFAQGIFFGHGRTLDGSDAASWPLWHWAGRILASVVWGLSFWIMGIHNTPR